MVTKTSVFDSAAYLDTREAVEAYLEDALESNDPLIIAHAIGVIARATGTSGIDGNAAHSLENLSESLVDETNPDLATVLRVIKALGLKLTIAPAHHAT